ncbi:MAG: TrkA family potassium uptake protein [Actinomycetota bacterium]|nr:TrkA family potassium uptake protein [Actinomycetota bacterium]
MRVAVAGAGNVGSYVAGDLLAKGFDVVVIEQNRELIESLKGQLAVNWVEGDACELHTLDEAVLTSCDAVVAATGDDEDNLVISLLAKQEFGVDQVVARVNHPANEWLFKETWGVDISVSMPHTLTSLVEEAVSVGDIVHLMTLERGRASLVEITLAEGSSAIGKQVGDLKLPPDCNLVAVVRDTHVIAPRPETPLSAGDEVVALASPEAEEPLKQALTG